MLFRFFLIAIIVLCPVVVPLSAFSETVQSLTLEQAFETAIRNNPDYRAMQAQIPVGEAQVKTATARLNPTILSDNGVGEKTYRLGFEQIMELAANANDGLRWPNHN